MTKVIGAKPNPKNDKQGFVKFEDGTEAWTPDIALLAELVGKELPHGWLLRDGKNGGKQLLPPREKGSGGGQSSWYNSEEGVRFTDERTDRRTALMQAVASFELTGGRVQDDIPAWADMYYTWLRATSGGAGLIPSTATTRSAQPSQAEHKPASPGSTSTPGSVDSGQGSELQTEAVASGPCPHKDNSPLKPDGTALAAGRIRCLHCGFTRKETVA